MVVEYMLDDAIFQKALIIISGGLSLKLKGDSYVKTWNVYVKEPFDLTNKIYILHVFWDYMHHYRLTK